MLHYITPKGLLNGPLTSLVGPSTYLVALSTRGTLFGWPKCISSQPKRSPCTFVFAPSTSILHVAPLSCRRGACAFVVAPNAPLVSPSIPFFFFLTKTPFWLAQVPLCLAHVVISLAYTGTQQVGPNVFQVGPNTLLVALSMCPFTRPDSPTYGAQN